MSKALSAVQQKVAEKAAAARQVTQAEQEQLWRTYTQAVVDSVANREVDPEAIIAAYTAVGLEFADYQRHIREEEERIALEELVAGEALLSERSRAYMAEREQIAKDVAEFNKEIERRVVANQRSIETNQRESLEINRAKNRLGKYLGVGRGFASNGHQELPAISRGG